MIEVHGRWKQGILWTRPDSFIRISGREGQGCVGGSEPYQNDRQNIFKKNISKLFFEKLLFETEKHFKLYDIKFFNF